jgi:hypothetical protein
MSELNDAGVPMEVEEVTHDEVARTNKVRNQGKEGGLFRSCMDQIKKGHTISTWRSKFGLSVLVDRLSRCERLGRPSVSLPFFPAGVTCPMTIPQYSLENDQRSRLPLCLRRPISARENTNHLNHCVSFLCGFYTVDQMPTGQGLRTVGVFLFLCVQYRRITSRDTLISAL